MEISVGNSYQVTGQGEVVITAIDLNNKSSKYVL